MINENITRSKTIAVAVAIGIGIAFSTPACSAGPGANDPVSIGMDASAVNSLIYIAQEQKYFEDNGITITIRNDYPSGAAAVEDMLKGEVDIATAAESVFVARAMAGEQILTLGSIDMFLHMKLIARQDRGLWEPSDLIGKIIGVPVNTAADFMLGRFLDINKIDRTQVNIVDVQSPQAVDSIINGAVDAVVTWQPNVITIQQKMGDGVRIWDVQNAQPMFCTLLVSVDWYQNHPDLSARFIKSLVQAQEYMVKNAQKSRVFMQERLGYEDSYIQAIWPEHQFALRLEKSMILAMEDQARWMISNNLTARKQVPDFLTYIKEDALKKMNPQAVNIIR